MADDGNEETPQKTPLNPVEDRYLSLQNISADSYTSCVGDRTSPGIESASFFTCISDSSTTSDHEKTLISSTPNKDQPGFKYFQQINHDQSASESSSPCLILDRSVDLSTKEEHKRDKETSLEKIHADHGSETENSGSSASTACVLQSESNPDVLTEDKEQTFQPRTLHASSIAVLGSDHKSMLDTPSVALKNRNSLSNETVKSSTSSIVVLGTSSQSLDCFPNSVENVSSPLQEYSVTDSNTLFRDKNATATPAMDSTDHDTNSSTFPENNEHKLPLLSPTLSQDTTSSLLIESPSQNISTKVRADSSTFNSDQSQHSQPSHTPSLEQSALSEENLQPSESISSSDPHQSSLPSNQTYEISQIRQSEIKNQIPFTEFISENGQSSSYAMTDQYEASLSKEIQISSDQTEMSSEIHDKSTSTVTSEYDKSFSLKFEGAANDNKNLTENEYKSEGSIPSIDVSVPKSDDQNISLKQSQSITGCNKSSSSSDTETCSLSPKLEKDCEIQKNLYPEVIVAKTRLELNADEIEALKLAEPVEYMSDTSPILLEEPLVLQSFPELSYDSSDTYIPSGTTTPYYDRSSSVLSSSYTTNGSTTDQRYVASDMFINRLASIVPKQDVLSITDKQKHMMNKLECTNEKLRSCNNLSVQQYDRAAENFKYYTKLLVEMRKDVETAFKRINSIKTKLAHNYPEGWQMYSTTVHTDFVHPDDEPDGNASEGGTPGNAAVSTSGNAAVSTPGYFGTPAAYTSDARSPDSGASSLVDKIPASEDEESLSRNDSYVMVGSYRSDKSVNPTPSNTSLTRTSSLSNTTRKNVSTYIIEDNDITQIG